MSAPFDPYYRWLGIPPGEQPPNHYRLLGVQLFEAAKVLQVLVSHSRQRDLGDVQFPLFDQMQQEIEGTLKQG